MNTDRISCGKARENLPLYVGGDLDGDVLEAVRLHLEGCAECARHAATAGRARRELLAAFRGREAERVASDLWPGIRTALRREGLVREPGRELVLPAAPVRARRARWALALVPVAAAAAVLILAQLGGLLTGASVPGHLGNPGLPRTGGEVVVTPVELPRTGGLQPVGAGEPYPQLTPPTRLRRGEPSPNPNDISLTGLHGLR